MEIEIKLFATFRECLPPGTDGFSFKKALPEETSVREVMEELKLPVDVPKIIIVNGRHATEDYVVNDGDVVSFFPPIAGG